MNAPHRRTRAAVTALLTGLLLTGCAGGPGASTGPTTGSTATPGAVSPTATAAPSGSVELPWPAAGAAAAAALQAAVDGGSQPWLLDPTEVAVSYAQAAHGWTDAEASAGPDGTVVDVHNGRGEHFTLTLAQPGRTGTGGIWMVTTEHPA